MFRVEHSNRCLLSVGHQDLVEIESAGGYHLPLVLARLFPSWAG